MHLTSRLGMMGWGGEVEVDILEGYSRPVEEGYTSRRGKWSPSGRRQSSEETVALSVGRVADFASPQKKFT